MADAVLKAARVAPNKGAAFDKACGIHIEGRLDPHPHLVIRATDLECTYLQTVRCAALTGGPRPTDPWAWRVPSSLLAGILAGLPIEPGGSVTLESDALTDELKIRAGKARSRIKTISGDYPSIRQFDASTLVEVPDFGQRVEQVAWATDPKGTSLAGVRIDGERIMACNRIAVVVLPLAVPVSEPITAPLLTLAALLKNSGDVSLESDGKKLNLLLDPDTQATSTLIMDPYPDLLKVLRDDFSGEFVVNREDLASAIERMMIVAKQDKYPRLKLGVMDGSVGVVMEDPTLGRMENEVEIKGGQKGDPFLVTLTPTNMLGALNHAGSTEVTVRYGPRSDKPISINASNYRADVQPMAR